MSASPAAPFVLRPMAAADVASVAAIEAASLPTPWSEQAFRHELELPFSCSRVATPADDATTVAGYVVWWRVADEIHLLDVAVAPDFRRQGVGRLLVGAVLDDAREIAARLITLEVEADNTSALALYVGAGFVTVLRRRDYYGAGRDALIMERAMISSSKS